MSKKQNLSNASVALYSAKQIKTIEQQFAESSDTNTYPLMERAGAGVLAKILVIWPHVKKIAIVTGKGNNAGDGFIIASLAAERRIQVILCQLNESKWSIKCWRVIYLINSHLC